MEEIWRDVKGFEGVYQVSSLGNIKKLPRLYSDKTKKGGKMMTGKYTKELFLKLDIGEYGKQRVQLSYCGDRYRFMVHILVAQAFPEICGEWSEGCDVHHIDGNPSNNIATNLTCLTKEKHQLIHRELGKYVGSNNPFYGKHHPEKIIKQIADKHCKSVNQYSLDGTFMKKWRSAADIEKETGMKKACINKCCLNKQHTAYGYRWGYA